MICACLFVTYLLKCLFSNKYVEFFLQHMIESITDKTPEVRQAAAYGIGAIGQFGGEVYANVLTGRYISTITSFHEFVCRCSHF